MTVSLLPTPSTTARSTACSTSPHPTHPHPTHPPANPVRPSVVNPASSRPFTLDQELKRFGTWADQPIWVPPKDSSGEMAKSMLQATSVFSSPEKRWQTVVQKHRGAFTQVREIELTKASIRLPKGKLFVSVTPPEKFDCITDEIPGCVQTRLDEFMSGPGRRRGVKVSYLKPLCVEVDDELHFTSRADIDEAIEKIRGEVFSQYRRGLAWHWAKGVCKAGAQAALFVPKSCVQYTVNRRQKALNDYRAKLEFQRRRTALRATKAHLQCRTSGCTFDEMLALTNPLETADVIRQYGIEKELTVSRQQELLYFAAGHLPWFTALSLGLSGLASVALLLTMPLPVCDPAFVAEMPDQPGVLWNIGHFDEINGVRHVEL